MSPAAGSSTRALLPCSEPAGCSQEALCGTWQMGEADLGSGPQGSWKEMLTESFSLQPPARYQDNLPSSCSASHGPALHVSSRAPAGQVLCQSCFQDPFLPQEATRPRGVHRRDQKQTRTFSTIQKLGTMHQRGKQTQLQASPTARHPNTAVWTRTSGTKGQEKLPNAQAQLPRGKGYLHQLPISEIWSPRPKQGEQGRVKLGTGETMRPGCPAGPEQWGQVTESRPQDSCLARPSLTHRRPWLPGVAAAWGGN